LWAGELPFVERLLAEDVRNNSAWHHRFFVTLENGSKGGTGGVADEAVRRELVFVKGKIALVPNNASAWNYFRGILNHAHMPYSTQAAFAELYVVDAVDEDTDRVVDLENPWPSKGAQLPCSAAIEFMADVHEARGKEGITEAVKLWHSLAHTHDSIRKRYWEFRIRDGVANTSAA